MNMIEVFYSLIFLLFAVLLVVRIFIAERYLKNIEARKIKEGRGDERIGVDEGKYTVIQPILSGDEKLERDLRANLDNTHKMKFIWLIDRDDREAIKIAGEIMKNEGFKERVEILMIQEVPQEINPKIFKIGKAIDKVNTEYTLILDDDTVMDVGRINEIGIYEKKENEWLATGIPSNYGVAGFWSKLVAAFVNSSSFLTYFTMAQMKETRTINGMFYIGKTAMFLKYDIFNRIRYFLCDDLALASALREEGVEIIQTGIFCNVRTTVKKGREYLLLMKRWLLFSRIYMKNNFTPKFFLIILLPALLSGIMVISGLYLSKGYMLLTLSAFFLKASAMYFFRYSLLMKKEGIEMILFEVLNDILFPLILAYTFVTPPVIKWRKRKIRVSDGRIQYL